MAERIAVVGGGWAGCAAACALARAGKRVTLYEQARTLGGRARGVEHDGRLLDNGQHILLGAYTATLTLLRLLAPREADGLLLRLPLQMRYPPGPAGMTFVAPRLPAPLHLAAALLRAQGLAREDKLALARFSTTARWAGWQLYQDCSVRELLIRWDQTPRLAALLWRPLCIAALNTPPERASAQVFLNVLRDSLGARRAASDMLIPRVDLSDLLPRRAGQYVAAHGGTVHLGTAVDAIERDGAGWRVLARGARHACDAVVLATSPAQAARLAGPFDAALAAQLGAFAYEPIVTCYLQYEAGASLPHPFYALRDDPAHGDWGQFVFDRGQLDTRHAGMLAVVVSAAGACAELAQETLAAGVAAQLARAFGRPELARPVWRKVIAEKRATFACTPGLLRPANASAVPGLVLAGDYTAGPYPATLEAAVASGLAAAKLALAA